MTSTCWMDCYIWLDGLSALAGCSLQLDMLAGLRLTTVVSIIVHTVVEKYFNKFLPPNYMNSCKSEFLKTMVKYAGLVEVGESLWREIDEAYSNKKRHYHNLSHLDDMLKKLQPYRDEFASWDAVVFAIAYHDFVYDVLKSDNEEKSAKAMNVKLDRVGIAPDVIRVCNELIVATKKHQVASYETNLFTDADLSILGSDPATYRLYSDAIRKEYSIFPSLVYNPGRKKVIVHFLEMDVIFKTKTFYEQYERRARVNLENELLGLK